MRLILTITCLLISVSAFSQISIQGTVIDGETNTPLPGANVFIAKTTKGVSTGIDGSFRITGLPPLHYQLVISFIGYDTQVLDVVPGQPITYKIILKPSSKTLNEIIVRAKKSSRAAWLANYAIFKENFIGNSENAQYCSITNPGVLSFDNDNQVLSAFSDSILYITNMGLGYRIKILLGKYEYNMMKLHLHYEGQMMYESLIPADQNQKKLWATNRLKAYNGSEMHFLRSLYARNLINDGFFFNLLGLKTNNGIGDTTIIVRAPAYKNKKARMPTIWNYNRILDSVLSTPEKPVMKFEGRLEIKYVNEGEGYRFQVSRPGHVPGSNYPQQSTIVLRTPFAIVQPHGQVYPQDAVETQGYWSWELIAESLPLDYDPQTDEEKLRIQN